MYTRSYIGSLICLHNLDYPTGYFERGRTAFTAPFASTIQRNDDELTSYYSAMAKSIDLSRDMTEPGNSGSFSGFFLSL